MKLQYTNILKMAPIYDNGSSLARELSDERVTLLLNDNDAFLKYISNGSAEIHWEKRKISHLQLIDNLLNSSYLEELKKAASFLDKWQENKVEQIINNVDLALPENWHSYRIPEIRKLLIVKLLTLRSQKIKKLMNV